MPTFKYRPYYQYNGPTRSQPFREELSDDEVQRNLDRFFNEVGSYFDNVEAQIDLPGDGVVEITAQATQADCDERVKRCLNSLDLFAQKIPSR